jgi:ADP-heptose:LPS heptosyltransferase
VERVHVWDAPWVGFEPPDVASSEVPLIIEELAGQQYDRAFVLVSFHQSPLPTALLLRLAGIPWIGADSVDYPGSLLDLRHQRAENCHEAEAATELLAAGGFGLPPGDDGRLQVRTPPETTALTGAAPYLVVHPGAAVPARAVAPKVAADAVHVLHRAGYRVVVTGAAAERALTAEVSGYGRYALDLGGRTDLAALSGVLAGADAVVVGNTGPAHLAAAVGTPVVSLFAPVVPAERWRPYRVPTEILGVQDAPCAGSRARRCPVPGHPCLDSLTGDDVLAAVRRLIDPTAEVTA